MSTEIKEGEIWFVRIAPQDREVHRFRISSLGKKTVTFCETMHFITEEIEFIEKYSDFVHTTKQSFPPLSPVY